jgi:protein AATF/BFR2
MLYAIVLANLKTTDFDPEALLDPAPSSSSDENSASESEDDGNAGRGHYADVGTSKLRKKEVVPLGPQYTGSKISRDAVDEDDSDDPFARGFDGEDSEEENSEGQVEVEDDVEYGEGVLHTDGGNEEDELEDEDEDEDGADFDSEDEGKDNGEDDDEDGEGEDQDTSDTSDDDAADVTSKLREMMKDEKSLNSTISQAAIADVTKGQAIKAQRKTFDTLLNTRIRLQKAIISTNSMATETYSKGTAPEASIEAAETAALTLLNNLTNLRSSLDSARTGEKRKRPEFTPSSTSAEIWSTIKADEKAALPHRKAIIEKWSLKTRGAAVTSSKGRLSTSVGQTLTDVLTSQLQDMPRLVARTQVPRSCAPLQSTSNVSSKDIYDDADWYGLLLKELLEQRSADLNTSGVSEFVVQQPWQVAREAKTRKIVDTKASKGRKLRYTVHEKLQNFMAPEERGEWGDRQRDELFGSLFGQRVGLGEEAEEKSEGEDVDMAEEGLMLFRS